MRAPSLAPIAEKKLTKEEKKAQAEAKKAEREAKKKQKQIDLYGEPDEEEGVEYSENYEEKKAKKKPDSKTSKKKEKSALEEEQEGANSGGSLQKLDEGTLKFAVCTGVLASRPDSKDVKIQSFSISLFGKQLFEDQTLELTWGHR